MKLFSKFSTPGFVFGFQIQYKRLFFEIEFREKIGVNHRIFWFSSKF